jgi:hypothetical protein
MSYPPPPPPPPPPFSLTWYGFEPCCGGNILYFKFDGTTVNPYEGINIYDGPAALGYDIITGTYVPLANQCYRIFRGNAVDPMSPIDAGNYNNLQVVPTNFGSNYTWDSTTTYETPCGSEVITCPPCQPVTYDLWPCDETLLPVTTDTDLSAYLDGFALIQVDADGGFDCYYVSISTDATNVVTVVVDGDTPCNCNCTCYEIIGSAKLRYVDCDGNPQSIIVAGYWKDCSLVYPVTSPAPGPNLIITNNGLCEDGACPGQCFELTDCDGLLDPIYATDQSLAPNATLGQTVIIQGYSNCWTVSDVVSCNAAIDVVVLQVYSSCATCSPAPNYILTNCEDTSTIVYTSSDLSAYVGQVIERDSIYPGCWVVDEYLNPIPSNVPITVTNAYDDCEACKTTYYVLSDCADIEADIITSTDLSAYVGDIIILEWCPTTCWSVAVSSSSVGAGVLGDISNQFNSCLECLTSFPCVCSRLKNHDTVSHIYKYLDCEGVVQTITLTAGERSDRICMAHWLTSYATDYVEYFGDCVNGVCPPPVYIKRSVKPGYNTPACSAEKYEKISCKASQALYRNVLKLRYGISNCCPEEEEYWLVKKELIDLAALYDPRYPCAPGSSCGCECAASDCSCNGPKTCNS